MIRTKDVNGDELWLVRDKIQGIAVSFNHPELCEVYMDNMDTPRFVLSTIGDFLAQYREG